MQRKERKASKALSRFCPSGVATRGFLSLGVADVASRVSLSAGTVMGPGLGLGVSSPSASSPHTERCSFRQAQPTQNSQGAKSALAKSHYSKVISAFYFLLSGICFKNK